MTNIQLLGSARNKTDKGYNSLLPPHGSSQPCSRAHYSHLQLSGWSSSWWAPWESDGKRCIQIASQMLRLKPGGRRRPTESTSCPGCVCGWRAGCWAALWEEERQRVDPALPGPAHTTQSPHPEGNIFLPDRWPCAHCLPAATRWGPHSRRHGEVLRGGGTNRKFTLSVNTNTN